jgi:hypothetical protein
MMILSEDFAAVMKTGVGGEVKVGAIVGAPRLHPL